MMTYKCTFCDIVKGRISPYKVYEDQFTLAFLDIHPLSKGHTLVIPKIHVQQIEELEEPYLTTLFKNVAKLARHVQNATNTKASLIGINNGRESGQEIPHVHIHIIPRRSNDGGGSIHTTIINRTYVSTEEMQEIAVRIRSEANKHILKHQESSSHSQ